MASTQRLQAILDAAVIGPEIFKLRPDYRALLIIASGITPGASDDASEALLKDAETSARTKLSQQSVTELPHVKAWREAYKSFGAKPQKYRNSLEALTRRAEGGLPRVNRLTDIYNAISVKHQIPLGGEDLDEYSGPPRLIRATGKEDFQVASGGQIVTEHPDAGEVVWVDDAGVTCRRWNWRQGPRTALSDKTKSTVFILDVLDPITNDELNTAADELTSALRGLGPNVEVVQRLISASGTQNPGS